MWAARAEALCRFGDIARLPVEEQLDRITVELLPGAVDGDRRAYPLGTRLAAPVQMRGLIPQHASTVRTTDGVEIKDAGAHVSQLRAPMPSPS